jgi:hypothetical protein
LQKYVPYSKGDGQVGERSPRILNIVFKLVRVIIAGQRHSGCQCSACLPIGTYLKVELALGKGQQTSDYAGRDVVAVLVSTVDSWIAKSVRIKTAPGPGDCAAGIEPLIVGAGETVGCEVRILVVGDIPQVYAKSQGMVFVRPGHIVDKVIHRHVNDGGAVL